MPTTTNMFYIKQGTWYIGASYLLYKIFFENISSGESCEISRISSEVVPARCVRLVYDKLIARSTGLYN